MDDTQISEAAGEEARAEEGPQAWHLPPPGIHVTGSQLRHRLITAESIAELQAGPAPSLLGRILGRLRRK